MRHGIILFGLGALAALAVAGCGGQRNPLLLPNQPPEVELFAQRLDHSAAGPYAYRLQWVAHDPDGRVDHYLYALGSSSADLRTTTWTSTSEREHTLSFPARAAAPARASIAAIEPSVFSVLAVDGAGARSTPARIAFFDGALAPQVRITTPTPNHLAEFFVNPTFCVEWEGTVFGDSTAGNARVVEYKFTLLTDQTPVTIATARSDPDSVRRYYAPRNWAGWDSLSGHAPGTLLRNLTPDRDYVFVVTCFDNNDNYDPIFSFDKNMLYMRVTYPGVWLPRLTVFNELFYYAYPQGVPIIFSKPVDLEVPAGKPITFNWFATPANDRYGNPVGGPIRGYRWALDLADVYDPRQGDDAGHSGHWTRWSLTTTSTTVGPFPGGETHDLYIETNADLCGEDTATVSLSHLRLHAVQPTFDKDLLIVDDTRLLPDRINLLTTCSDPSNRPLGNWPTAAELDTFLYAVGGAPWRCYPPGTFSTPGVFSGYSFDTLGTRMGMADLTVPLSTLGHYRNVIWLTDGNGARNARPGTDPSNPLTSMRYMNDGRKENTLAAFVQQGGRVWLAGGGAPTASLINFNRFTNDVTGPIPHTLTFASANDELGPGRFVYDQAHWRSELKQYLQLGAGTIERYLGRLDPSAGGSPGIYAGLPTAIQLKSPATDPFPPNRVGQSPSVFYQTRFDVEFLSAANEITEDLDPRSHHDDVQSALDTLYKVRSPNLRPDTGPDAIQSVAMTYYHGDDNAPFIVTGFNLWNFRRSDCVALVDFVLQQLWGLSRQAPVAGRVETRDLDVRPAGKPGRPHSASMSASGAARRE